MKSAAVILLVAVIFLSVVFIYNFIKSRKRIKALNQIDSVGDFNKAYRHINSLEEESMQKDNNIMNSQIDFIEKDMLHSKIQAEIHGDSSKKTKNSIEFKF